MNSQLKTGALTALSLAIALGPLVLSPTQANAADITTTFTVGIGQSDNILRTPNNHIEESMGNAGVRFGLVESTRKFNADIVANLDYLTYLDDAFDDDLTGGATVLAGYDIVEEFLEWDLQYNFGQQVFNPLAPVRPDNQEDVSFLTTGPRMTLPLGSRHEFGLDLTYSDVNYEINLNSNSRKTARARFTRALNENRNLSIIGSVERIEFFESPTAPDFDRNRVFLRYESISTRNTISADIGVNSVQLDGQTDSNSGTLIRFNWVRNVSSSSLFQIGGGRVFSDQGDVFRMFQNAQSNVGDPLDIVGVENPFENDFLNVRYSRQRDRNGFEISAMYNGEDYENDSTLNRTIARASVSFTRDLTNKFFGEIGVDVFRRDFEALDRQDDDLQGTVTLGYDINPAFSTSLSYQYFKRSTDSGAIEFDENRIFLFLNYIPKWSREEG